MTLRQWMAVGCAVTLSTGNVFGVASTDIQTAVNQIQSDSTLISGWMTGQLKYVVPFNSTAGNVVPSQLKVFGVEVGVEGVVSGTEVDVASLRNLPTSIVDTTKIDAFGRFPMPAVLGHAKIGLPFGLDAGVRIGGIPKRSFDKDTTHVSVKNSIIGIDVRKKLIEEGIAKPFGLTVGANFTRASGSIDATTPYHSKGQAVVNGTTYNSSLDGTGTGHSEWDVKSYGVQAILNKQMFFINPYVGASVNKNAGSLSTSITTTGTETITNAGNPADTSSQTFTPVVGAASDSPHKWDIRALAGLEFTLLPFVKLGLQGEYAGTKNIAGALGLRVQFR